jgi:hypothetical protein
VELARADLDFSVARYRRTPQGNSQLSLLILENQVAQAELLLQGALQDEKADPHEAHIKCLESSADLAKRQFDWFSEFSKTFTELFPNEKMKRFHLNLELAQLAIELGKDPIVSNMPMDHLQWQIEQLELETYKGWEVATPQKQQLLPAK